MDSSKIFTCEICEKNFSTNFSKGQHMKIVHGEVKIFKCNVCSKTFGLKRQLMIHTEINHKIKDHFCKLCGKDFARSVTLSEHIIHIHEGERNYKCDSCGKSFTKSGKLKNHIKTIHDNHS